MEIEEYFRDKGCVVTGAASGIGFAVSEALLKAGAVVFMADRDVGKLASASERLSAYAGRVHPVTVDVTKQEQVQGLIEDAASRHGRLDCLFNNAGIGATAPIEKVTLEHWRTIIDVNLWSVIYGIDAALPVMRRQGGGHIISTSSIAGLIPFPFQALYCATKYAVAGMSESLRLELADEGIHFSIICPGNVATAIFGEGVKPPPDAISAEEAAQITLAGVANRKGIIVFPEQHLQMWRMYWSSPDEADSFLLNMARQRRESFRTTGSYY